MSLSLATGLFSRCVKGSVEKCIFILKLISTTNQFLFTTATRPRVSKGPFGLAVIAWCKSLLVTPCLVDVQGPVGHTSEYTISNFGPRIQQGCRFHRESNLFDNKNLSCFVAFTSGNLLQALGSSTGARAPFFHTQALNCAWLPRTQMCYQTELLFLANLLLS